MLVIGRFILENSELNVTILQAIKLDLKTIKNEPSVYDLPVTPPFGCYSALCKSSEINKNKPLHFTLERRGYNSITLNYLTVEIDCAFDAGTTRHAGVPNAIENKAILSVCGELYKGNNMMHIIASDIKWNNVFTVNKASTPEQATNNKKKRNQDLLNFKDKCKNKKVDKKPEQALVAESTNNKLNYEEPMDKLNNESEDKIEDKPGSECDKQQNETEKNISSRADKLKSALRNNKK